MQCIWHANVTPHCYHNDAGMAAYVQFYTISPCSCSGCDHASHRIRMWTNAVTCFQLCAKDSKCKVILVFRTIIVAIRHSAFSILIDEVTLVFVEAGFFFVRGGLIRSPCMTRGASDVIFMGMEPLWAWVPYQSRRAQSRTAFIALSRLLHAIMAFSASI